MTIGFGKLKKWLINNQFPIAPHTLLSHMGLACCQKLLRLSAWEAFVEGKLWEAYIACGGISMHVVVFTHTQIRGLHFGVKGANGRLGHGDTEDRICPTLVYYPGLSWMWNHGLVHVKPAPASSPHNGTVNNFEGLQTRLTTTIDVRAANGFFGRWYKWKTGNRSQE